jgi:hypothetical protein
VIVRAPPAPVLLGVYVTLQVDVPALPDWSVHVEEVKLPAPPPVLQEMVPVGVIVVPALVSLTVAVHVVAVPTATGFGVHKTLVLVARLSISWKVPVLALWLEVGAYVAVMVTVPAAL